MRDLLLNVDTSATCLHMICLRLMGAEYINYEPETIQLELEEFLDEAVPEINLNKINAVATLLATEIYYEYFESFEAISNALLGRDPMFTTLTPLDTIQVACSIYEARIIDEDKFQETENMPFSKEMEAYIKCVMQKDGVLRTPKVLKRFILPEYDDGGDEDQIREQVSYERELNHIISSKVKKIKEECKESVK